MAMNTQIYAKSHTPSNLETKQNEAKGSFGLHDMHYGDMNIWKRKRRGKCLKTLLF
jgi:hypothetical protein